MLTAKPLIEGENAQSLRSAAGYLWGCSRGKRVESNGSNHPIHGRVVGLPAKVLRHAGGSSLLELLPLARVGQEIQDHLGRLPGVRLHIELHVGVP
jgi:hypothetical protein